VPFSIVFPPTSHFLNQSLITSIKRRLSSIKEQEDWKKEEDHAPAHIKAKYIMMDCEMVGIGFNGKQSARV
jgi:hypothetical protein